MPTSAKPETVMAHFKNDTPKNEMKTISEIKFDTIGHIINVQKSAFGSKDSISFTINTGIFVPEYWATLKTDRQH